MIQKNERRRYASNLSDSQWAIIEPLLPQAGNRSKWEQRELVDAVLYFVDNGCKWRNLLAVVVHVANIHGTKSGIWATRDGFKKYPSIQRFRADAGYRKTFEQDVSRELGRSVDISVHIKPEWEVLPKR